MPITLTLDAVEESTYVLNVAFYDEDDNTVTPNSVNWTLTDVAGTVINSRTEVVLTPAIAVDIVLTGDDLALGATRGEVQRIVTIQAVYDSDAGNDLNLKESAILKIKDLTYIS